MVSSSSCISMACTFVILLFFIKSLRFSELSCVHTNSTLRRKRRLSLLFYPLWYSCSADLSVACSFWWKMMCLSALTPTHRTTLTAFNASGVTQPLSSSSFILLLSLFFSLLLLLLWVCVSSMDCSLVDSASWSLTVRLEPTNKDSDVPTQVLPSAANCRPGDGHWHRTSPFSTSQPYWQLAMPHVRASDGQKRSTH